MLLIKSAVYFVGLKSEEKTLAEGRGDNQIPQMQDHEVAVNMIEIWLIEPRFIF